MLKHKKQTLPITHVKFFLIKVNFLMLINQNDLKISRKY
jgi:hypothetical protein